MRRETRSRRERRLRSGCSRLSLQYKALTTAWESDGRLRNEYPSLRLDSDPLISRTRDILERLMTAIQLVREAALGARWDTESIRVLLDTIGGTVLNIRQRLAEGVSQTGAITNLISGLRGPVAYLQDQLRSSLASRGRFARSRQTKSEENADTERPRPVVMRLPRSAHGPVRPGRRCGNPQVEECVRSRRSARFRQSREWSTESQRSQ